MSDLEQQRVAMGIMAHPDDAEFGCAGTISGWAREGWDVYYVVITDASGGGPDEAIDVGPAARGAITATRKAEQRWPALWKAEEMTSRVTCSGSADESTIIAF